MKLLGINIDHIATIRNARNGRDPDLIQAINIIHEKCKGVSYITIHLREDRRHIRDLDAQIICKESPIKINLEIACTEEMVNFAIKNKPYAVCFVPEKREEMTTESGLDIVSNTKKIQHATKKLQDIGIKVTLFLDPISEQIVAAKEIGVDTVEIHTGQYANESELKQMQELYRIKSSAELISQLEMECHAGHGLNYENIKSLININQITLFNIGHFLIGEAIFFGIENVVNKMHMVINPS